MKITDCPGQLLLSLKKFYSKNKTLVNASFLLFVLTFSLQMIVFGQFSFTKLPIPFLLFFALCTFFRPYFAAINTILLEALLLRIHYIKVFHTRTALNAIDLLEFKQATALSGYVDYPLLIIGMLLTVVLIWSTLKFRFNWKFSPILLLFIFSTYTDITSPTLQNYGVITTLENLNVEHFMSNWRKNIRRHGILTHLSQTSGMVKIPEPGKHNFLERFKAEIFPAKSKNENPDIYLVMCESCFTTFDDKFKTPIVELKKHGYESATIISPKYGGGTADVEFEALTGLPSDNLNGIKYQFYGNHFAQTSRTLPRALSEIGYLSMGFHNFRALFWRRNEVYPRLGFLKSYFIEDMHWDKEEDWRPEDSVLYKSALHELQQNVKSEKSFFFFMITMFTHGEYESHQNDGGEKSYKDAMRVTTDDFLAFQKQVKKISKKRNRPAYIIVFGDHKPSLTEVFHKYGVLSPTDEENEFEAGKVPLFIKGIGTPKKHAKEFIKHISLKPVYCLPTEIVRLTNLRNPYYASLEEACENDTQTLIDKKWKLANFPKELYGEMLFNDIATTATKKHDNSL